MLVHPWLCVVAALLCCHVQTSSACPYLQRKMAEKQQQKQQQSPTTTGAAAATEEVVRRVHSVVDSTHQVQRRAQSACGNDFCYGSLVDLPALELDWATLVDIARPSGNGLVGYMEDSRAREEELGGFPLNNGASNAAAGYTYLGQLLSHDMNMDATSTLGVPVDPATLPNTNNPAVDLDTIYSHNGCTPNLENGTHFIVNDRDYERDSSGAALNCDPRNDEHRILSQITVAWMTLHNKFVDDFGLTFEEARDATVREWQSVVLSDMLPNLLDTDTLSAVSDGDRVLYVGTAFDSQTMPAEFSTAAYRLFHSRARTNYRLNSNEIPVLLFDVGDDEPNLVGGSPLPDDFVIEWERFFGDPTQGPRVTEAARILDMLYPQPIMSLPFGEAGTPDGPEIVVDCDAVGCPIVVDEPESNGVVMANLALLDLLRGQTHSLPGGIAYAQHVASLGVDLDVMEIADMAGNVFGLPDSLAADDVPLLLYLAHESIRDSNGEVLGQLGSRIVAEVIYGLIETATPSILEELDESRPIIPTIEGGTSPFVSRVTSRSDVTMREVLTYIGWD